MNFVGTDATGTAALGNGGSGVRIVDSPNNRIGGTNAGDGNLISANAAAGVCLVSMNAHGNVVQGNFIGTDLTGTTALGNLGPGVCLESEPFGNLIGGTSPAERNIISGNLGDGILFRNLDLISMNLTGNRVQGNFIGTDVTGTMALGNIGNGVCLDGASGNFIGGSGAGEGNVISANGLDGVCYVRMGAHDNPLQGNFIGTNATGTAALGNAGNGVRLSDEAHGNLIGGTSPAERNIISGNLGDGILLHNLDLISMNLTENRLQGNFIGTDVMGTTALGNTGNGVCLIDADNAVIGGAGAGEGNVISANGRDGLCVISINLVSMNLAATVQSNLIGLDVNGAAGTGLDNGRFGIAIESGSDRVSVAGAISVQNLKADNAATLELFDSLTSTGPVEIQGGTLKGSGTINTNVLNGGTMRPGTSPGLLNVNGDYTQTADGQLEIEIAGTVPGTEYDQLNISGHATIDGTLNINLVDGFTPQHGQTFQALAAGSSSGSFATTNVAGLGEGISMGPVFTEEGLVIAAGDMDFNDDGAYGCVDVDELVARIVSGPYSAALDLNADGLLDSIDLEIWLAGAGLENGLAASYLLGDSNLDSVVDGLDFVIWNSHKFTAAAAWCSGDSNADGVVDGLDFVIWNSHKFTGANAPRANLAEPEAENIAPFGLQDFARPAQPMAASLKSAPSLQRPTNRVGRRNWKPGLAS
jgi:hypothetical protein